MALEDLASMSLVDMSEAYLFFVLGIEQLCCQSGSLEWPSVQFTVPIKWINVESLLGHERMACYYIGKSEAMASRSLNTSQDASLRSPTPPGCCALLRDGSPLADLDRFKGVNVKRLRGTKFRRLSFPEEHRSRTFLTVSIR